MSKAKDDPIVREMVDIGYATSIPSDRVTLPKEWAPNIPAESRHLKLNDAEYDKLLRNVGKFKQEYFAEYINGRDWDTLDVQQKVSALKSIEHQVEDQVRRAIILEKVKQ